jgi:hypothetical protein
METKMVDSATAIALSVSETVSFQSQSSGGTTSTSLEAGVEAAALVQDANGDQYGVAVVLDVGTATTTGTTSTDAKGQQALATLKATAAEAKAFPQKDAKDRLARALAELKLLKLLGGGTAGAQQATQIAKQIAAAATEYSEAGGSSSTATTAPTTAAAALNTTDPFFLTADGALSQLRKYLQQVLPPLEESKDKKARDAARQARAGFNQAVDETATAENLDNVSTDSSGSDGSPASAAADGGTAFSAPTGSYQPIDLSA